MAFFLPFFHFAHLILMKLPTTRMKLIKAPILKKEETGYQQARLPKSRTDAET